MPTVVVKGKKKKFGYDKAGKKKAAAAAKAAKTVVVGHRA
jgi:hypothetical protein|tara:strand:- start:1058 stop:1177 length:120 start_codon:yes stop_codon:yes gene_type:complete